jgi:hypothetical protein
VTVHKEIVLFRIMEQIGRLLSGLLETMAIVLSHHRGLSPRIIVRLGIACLDGLTSEEFRIIERPVFAALAKSVKLMVAITYPEDFTLEGCTCPLQCCQLLTVHLSGPPRRTNCRSGATANLQCVQAEIVAHVGQRHETH